MTTTTDRLYRLTYADGTPVMPATHISEPHPGSIVMTSGEWGTAWQRYFTDGLWHRVGSNGRGRTWDEMLTMRNLVLVYDAHIRPDPRERDEELFASGVER